LFGENEIKLISECKVRFAFSGQKQSELRTPLLLSLAITPDKHGVLAADRAAWYMVGKLLVVLSWHSFLHDFNALLKID
jgi:hypothetical protein